MRTFVAFDLEREIRERIFEFIEKVRKLAPDARWVSRESLHVTLKFIGEKPDQMTEKIEAALARVRSAPFALRFRGTGFFPNPKSARVFWIGIEDETGLGRLAGSVEESLAQIGVEKEKRGFQPHLTVARASGASGAPEWRTGDRTRRQFHKLEAFLSERPREDFGSMTVREFFLYHSRLSTKGSEYRKMAGFTLSTDD
jgi:RNA 2',3'-cyclic 3'-phosphodiesterase